MRFHACPDRPFDAGELIRVIVSAKRSPGPSPFVAKSCQDEGANLDSGLAKKAAVALQPLPYNSVLVSSSTRLL